MVSDIHRYTDVQMHTDKQMEMPSRLPAFIPSTGDI